jgi:hypothetical protein
MNYTIEIWHPDSNGNMTHYVQETDGNIRKYYTSGKLVDTREVLENGCIKEK